MPDLHRRVISIGLLPLLAAPPGTACCGSGLAGEGRTPPSAFAKPPF